ncbi:glycosyltransferase [Acetobacter indonesiensis]|uniref:glycosyltransferase n=2 Tax=Acetobacter indonesiensis TaxID=104101 RepID=UPI0039EAE599
MMPETHKMSHDLAKSPKNSQFSEQNTEKEAQASSTLVSPDLTHQLQLAEDLVEGYRASARLQALRSDGMFSALAAERHYRDLEHGSLSWKVTLPLRAVRALLAGRTLSGRPVKDVTKRVREIAREEGLKSVWDRVVMRLPDFPVPARFKGQASEPSVKAQIKETKKRVEEIILSPVSADTRSSFTPFFLIVAELSIPQCAKYRVWQRKEALESLGWRVEVVDWHDLGRALSLLQTCTHVIFYRVPGNKEGMQLIREAHRLSLNPWWEVDDLIFDPASYEKNSNLETLSGAERRNVLDGVVYYRAALQACHRAIASTRGLAAAMKEAGVSDVSVIENALDTETLAKASQVFTSQPNRNVKLEQDIIIFYGSGTKTHDMDFRVAAAGIAAAMEADSRLRLQIVGDLSLPVEFARFGSRVEKLPGRSYNAYLELLAQADIAIAPLEPTLFNDAKSNIKYLEAAIVGVPSVCSPAQAFQDVIVNGKTGYLAATEEEWKTHLLTLAASPSERQSIGNMARLAMTERYDPDTVATQQVQPVCGKPIAPAREQLRVMMVNVFFEPRSFGGATLVAEEMAKAMRQRGVDVAVMTSRPYLPDHLDAAIRYHLHDMAVLSVPVQDDPISGLDNPTIGESFREWVRAWAPDLVHFHAIQGLGVSMMRVCQELGIPYVVTLHDAWWLCERQFMVKADGQYCFQKKIDLRVCETCVPGARHLRDRAVLMHESLKHASALLSPSRSHLDLYAANGFAVDRLIINKNGFVWPRRPHTKRHPGDKIRFGYVGGNEKVKGFPLIKEAFENIDSDRWELVLVDNTIKLGFKSINVGHWKVRGEITVVPSYTAQEIDDFFDRIDVLLFPSQWKESFGLTVREALARDVWVVSTSPGGQSEDIIDGVNGNLIPLDGQPNTLKNAISEIIENDSRFDNYENKVKNKLSNHDAQAHALLQIYCSIAER